MAVPTSLSAIFARRIQSPTLDIRPAVRSSADAVALFDHNFRLTTLNVVARKILGRPGQKLLGRRCDELFRCNADDPARLLAHALECTSASRTLYVRATGRCQPLAIRAVELRDAEGKVESIFVVIKIAAVPRTAQPMPVAA
jgi:PAS domain S-box-containing protein